MSIYVFPWALACATAAWFGLLAVRAGKSWPLWALVGGVFGLVSSTCVFGLGEATAIPFSDRDRSALHVEWTLIAIAIILLVGGLFTWSLWRKTQAVVPDRTQPTAVADKKTGKNAP